MKFLTVKNIWCKIKEYLGTLSSSTKATSTSFDHKNQVSDQLLTEIARVKSCPIKRYSFKQFECSLDEDDNSEKRSFAKTKKIQKQKKLTEDLQRTPKKRNREDEIPLFIDEYGVQVSSIGKRSNNDDSFDLQQFQEIFKDGQEINYQLRLRKQKKEQKNKLKSRLGRSKLGNSKVYNRGYRLKR